MAIYTLTPAQLRGAGVYNSFEIPSGGNVPSFSNVNSFTFDGTDDYITSTLSPFNLLDGQNKMTLSLWMKPISGAPLLEYVLSNPRDTTANNSQFALVLYENNTISFNVQSRTSQYVSGNINAVTYGAWNHILVCVDLARTIGTEGAIFINGNNETTTSAMGTLSSFYTATDALHIGIDANGGFNRYNGNIDELAIWSGTDLRSEVSAVWNSGIPGDLNNSGLSRNPDLWYRMGENATWTGREFNITDAAGNYSALSNNMAEDAKTTDVPPNPFTNTLSTTFDGVDDWVSVLNNNTIARTQNISYSIWVKLVDGATRQYLVGNWTSSNGGTGLSIETSNTLLFQLGDGTNDSYFNSRVTNFTTYAPNNTWNHILATWDGNDAKIYINGILRNTWTPTNLTISNWSAFWIGRRDANGNDTIYGNLDEVSIFNNDQSANVSSIFNQGVPNNISGMNGLVSWWRMGDGSIYPTINDEIGSNYGTMTNMTSANFVNDVPEFNTKSILLDGVDDFVSMGNVLNMADDGTDVFSISLWFKTTSTSTQMLMSKQTNASPYNGYNLYMSANRFKFSLGTLTASAYINGQTGLIGSMSDGNWHHLTLTYDGSQDISSFTLYYDNSNITLYTIANNTPNSVGNSADFLIGARGTGASSALVFSGTIDEASYFNSELSASDVSTIYNSGVPNDISSLNPVGWWRCGDGDTSPTLIDNGSGGNNGTMTNFTTFSTDVPT